MESPIPSETGAQEDFALMLRNIRDYAIIVMDPEGRIRHWNSGASAIFGYSAEEAAGKDAALLFTSDDRASGQPAGEMQTADRIHRAFDERWHIRKDGSKFWASGMLYPLGDESGKIHGFVKILRDATLDRRVQEARKMESVGRLAGGVAHDFNNMLTLINGYSELLLGSSGLDPAIRDGLEEIRMAGERAASLTRQLLAFGGRQILEPIAFDLNALIARMEKRLGEAIGDGNRLRLELRADLDPILMDPSQMEQILLNLARNSRDAMESGGLVTIATGNRDLRDPAAAALSLKPGSYALLTFRDNGKGMDAMAKANLFEPFFTARKMGSSPGSLGMAGVYGVVSQSGGTIAVENPDGPGTELRIFLPALSGAEKPEGAGTFAFEGDLDRPIALLIVEDEESLRQLTGRIARAHGYQVLEARDGEGALNLLAGGRGDVRIVLTDIIMPGMGGFELAGHIRAKYPDMRIVFMSGYADDNDVRRETSDGSTLFLQKPFSPARLLEKLSEALTLPVSR